MPGLLCLQGGREFTPECRDMDAEVLAAASVRNVAVLAGAARVGSDYDGASSRAFRHYVSLGVDVTVVPDPREGRDRAVEALSDDLDLLVLPGGSPGSLLDALTGPVRDRLVELHDRGMALSGASAGAMVLCTRMVLPDQGTVVDGLGLADGLALPHWTPGNERGWAVPDLTLWGLPECGGVIVDEGEIRAVGRGTPSVRVDGTWRPVAR